MWSGCGSTPWNPSDPAQSLNRLGVPRCVCGRS
jgi:hypothetical protein